MCAKNTTLDPAMKIVNLLGFPVIFAKNNAELTEPLLSSGTAALRAYSIRTEAEQQFRHLTGSVPIITYCHRYEIIVKTPDWKEKAFHPEDNTLYLVSQEVARHAVARSHPGCKSLAYPLHYLQGNGVLGNTMIIAALGMEFSRDLQIDSEDYESAIRHMRIDTFSQ